MNTNFARRQMVEQQIRTWDVFDANVLNAFGGVAREEFVPADCANVAYADAEIPLPHQQCMFRPSLAGRVLQALQIKADDEVLEIGTGTGYLTACLAQLATNVTSIDIFDDFVTQARRNLADTGIENVSVHCMDAMSELPAGQFDVIVITASVRKVDDRIIAALKPQGRLFVFVGKTPAKSATLMQRGADDSIQSGVLFETDVPELLNLEKVETFSF
jgi:protein-L-isoaspartate(D-aspartate) O-methyltransferase